MKDELLTYCELVMARAASKDRAYAAIDGTVEKKFAYDRAVKAWSMAYNIYQIKLSDDIEENGAYL